MLRRGRRLECKSPEQVLAMRRAGLVVAAALTDVVDALQPGISGHELDQIAERTIRERGATPSFLGYMGFPASICVSVDEQIVHGIPNRRPLRSGQIVSIDCGAIVDGWHGDAAVTVAVGDMPEDAAVLVETTREALWAGLAQARPGRRLSDIGAAVEDVVTGVAAGGPTGRNGFGIVRDYVGHGIGRQMHMPPDVPNVGPGGRGPRLEPGVVLAVEPMVTAGSPANQTLADGWTVVTDDGSLAAHWEHTVAVTDTGPWVLTALDGGRAELGDLASDLAGD